MLETDLKFWEFKICTVSFISLKNYELYKKKNWPPSGSVVKNLPAKAGDTGDVGSTPG